MFTAENAAIFARKSHAPDSARHKPKPAAIPADSTLQPVADPLAADLVRVQEQLVEKMLKANGNPDSIPKLARSFRDVREAFHLVTGIAKPGVIRETGRTSKRGQAKPLPLPSTPQGNEPDQG